MSIVIRRLSLPPAIFLLWAASGVRTWACPVCFRMEDGPVTDGVFAAVLVLLGVTSLVLAGFARFIRGFVRRAGDLDGGPPSHGFDEPRRSPTSGGGDI